MTDTSPSASAPRTLAGKTALITGGSGGIGLHTARGLAALAIWLTVTESKPERANSRRAVSAMSCRVCCFLRPRRPGSVITAPG